MSDPAPRLSKFVTDLASAWLTLSIAVGFVVGFAAIGLVCLAPLLAAAWLVVKTALDLGIWVLAGAIVAVSGCWLMARDPLP